MSDDISEMNRSGPRYESDKNTSESPFEFNSELSEVDQHILELNHEGYSMKEISVLLKERYDIILSKPSVIRHLSELRQDPDNKVQINHEYLGPQKIRSETKWYRVIERLANAIPEYESVHGFKPSSRTMYYQLIDEKIITGSESDHNKFVDSTVKARLGWIDSNEELLFPKLDIDCFADDNSRYVSDDFEDYAPEETTEPGPIPDPKKYIDLFISRVKFAIRYFEGSGEEGDAGRIGGRWHNQPEYVEVWEEKNDLLPGFKSMLYDKRITIRANKGYPSLLFLYRCTKELKELIDRTGLEPENIHIKYCGDWDPSGENIDWYIKRRLKQLGLDGIDFQRVAVTPEQIEEYDLPLLDIKKKPEKKLPNPNMREFIRRHGNKATHLNAFFTEKHFNIFKKILQESVDDHWDPDIYQEKVDEYDVDPEEPEEMDEDELEDAKIIMCKKATEAFGHGWGTRDGIVEEDYEDVESEDETEDDGNEE